MYAVVITDEGGVRRRLDFSKPEVTVGRVQGNDIVLAKRNVSKQHARLTWKGDQAVVVDLNSTNGTWVNGRKITAPHPLKQGDKIYIADFILTLEPATDRASAVPRVSEPPPIPSREAPTSSTPQERSEAARELADQGSARPGPAQPPEAGLPNIEDRATDAPPAEPAPPRVRKAASSTPKPDPLTILLERLATRIDLDDTGSSGMQSQERWSAARAAIAETFLGMQTDGSVEPNVDMRHVAHFALHEAVGLGALDDLLSDQSVRSIVVNGPDHVFVDRGEGVEATKLRFSSTTALRRVARRLAAQSGQALEAQPALHGRLSFGPRLTIMQPPLVTNDMVIELRVGRAKSLGELAEAGWMTADAATHLGKAVAECRNIVVAGPRGSGVTELLSALARELPETETVVAIEAVPDLDVDRARTVCLTAVGAGISLSEAIEHGSRLRAERLLIDDLSGAHIMTALASLLGREPGHLLGVHCFSTKDAVEGLLLAAGCGGAERACVAQLVGSSIDLVVAMHRGPGGPRVAAILEVQGHEGGDVSYQSVPF